ncbi:MAG: hypothetical protein ABI806_24565 [Candidatus Solibacter sp.]
MKLTRRKLAATLVSATALSAQQTQPPPPAAPDDLLQIARDRLKANAAALSAVPLPMGTEPAFQFKA